MSAHSFVLTNLTTPIISLVAVRSLLNQPENNPAWVDLFRQAAGVARFALERDAAWPAKVKSVVSRNMAKALASMVDAGEARLAEGWRDAPSAAEEDRLAARAQRLYENVQARREKEI